MSRIIAIDYGLKRTGIAVTDENRMIANGLTCVETNTLISFLKTYIQKENVGCIVVGKPKKLNNQDTHASELASNFIKVLKRNFTNIDIEEFDERFTSKMAFQTMIDAGLKKNERKNKALIDTISATILLQSYMEYINHKPL